MASSRSRSSNCWITFRWAGQGGLRKLPTRPSFWPPPRAATLTATFSRSMAAGPPAICASFRGDGSAMAQITQFKGYQGDRQPTIPKPAQGVDPMIVTVQDGVPVVYPGCHGVG